MAHQHHGLGHTPLPECWEADGRPDTSVINVNSADQTIANAVVVEI